MGGDEVEQEAAGGRLAAPALADEAERLTPVHVQRHPGDGRHLRDGATENPTGDRELLDETGGFEQRGAHGVGRQSSDAGSVDGLDATISSLK